MTDLPPIDVRVYGDHGPPVVVLHGGPGAPGSASGLAKALAHRFRVLEPLQRRAGTVPLTVERHVADLAGVAPQEVALVGWSWGAMLALSFAAKHPGRVRSLGLVGIGTYSEADRAEHRARMAQRLGPEGQRKLEALRKAARETTDAMTRDRLLEEEGALATAAQSVDVLEDRDDALEVDAEGYRQTWDDVLRLQALGLEPAAFATIRAPALMLHGADDPHPGRATFATLRPHLPHLEYREFDRCGHLPWRERHARQAFFDALVGWLDQR